MLFLGPNKQRSNVEFDNLDFEGVAINVETMGAIRILGFHFDCDLSMKAHVTKLCKSSHFILRNIGKIRKLVNEGTAKTLVQSTRLLQLFTFWCP